MNNTIFGLTETQFTNLAMAYGLPLLILFMLFIIGNLAWKSKAGKFGTFILFIGLAAGMLGFTMKYVVEWYLSSRV